MKRGKGNFEKAIRTSSNLPKLTLNTNKKHNHSKLATSSAFAVLSIIGVVGVLAVVALVLANPTGQVAQGESIYPTADIGVCQGKTFYLGEQSTFSIYCCQEDMIGQNTCKRPQRIYHIQ